MIISGHGRRQTRALDWVRVIGWNGHAGEVGKCAVEIDDLCKGEVRINLRELDDWVMVRPDGMPTYNFACVVDDLEMGITHVVRGDEHTMNGFKQAVLFDVLGAAAPRFAHIPLILGKNGKKLSKRDAVTNILDYRDQGYLPEAILNGIALLGWSYSGDRDLFSRDELIEKFRIDGIHKGGAKFDADKLLWMNGEYLRGLSLDELVERVRPFTLDAVPEIAFGEAPSFVRQAVACYRERCQLLTEFAPKLGWIFADGIELDDDAKKKLAKQAEAPEWLAAYADSLEALELPPSWPADRREADLAFPLPTTPETEEGDGPCAGPKALEAHARAFCEERDIKFGHFVHPVRAALTGTTKGPGLFDCVFLLGRTRALARLRACAG